MATYVCDICQKQVKNLKDHKKRVHPVESEQSELGKKDEINQITKTKFRTLKLKTPKHKAVDEKTYHCAACGTKVTKGLNPCPGCGESLEWGGF